jgi:hypothetical protein
MNFKIFKNKKTSTNEDKLLLAQPTMLFGSLDPEEYTLVATHIVKDDEIVRPDLLAVQYYGSDAGLDIILKFNGISDPFSIMPGETIYVPLDTIPYYKLDSPDMYEENPIKQQFIDTKRLSKTDQRRIEALKKKYNKETLLPPNVIPVGKKTYEFDGTMVRLGMHAQTDPVVNAILSDINGNDNVVKTKNTDPDLVIDTADNSQVTNTPINNGVSFEDALIKNSGVKGTGVSSGAGAGISVGKTDKADNLGGGKPDGSAPANKDNNPTNNPDSPCSK